MDANGEIDEICPRCAKSLEELPHFSCTAVNYRTDVDLDMLDHGEVSFRERKHWLAEIVVVESKSVLPIEYRQSFFIKKPTSSENAGGDVTGSAARVARDSIWIERALWVN